MFLILNFLFLCGVAESNFIDITIMVPGIKAFKELAMQVDSVREETNQRTTENIDTFEYDNSVENESAFDSGYSADYSGSSYFEFNGDRVNENCISATTNEPNIICIHDINLYYTYPWSYVFVKPSLDIALETIKKTKNLLDGHHINLHYYDSSDNKGKVSTR